MNGRLRVAVVGCGVQAQLALLPALKANSAIELVALCDIDVRKLHQLSARYNVKRYYTDFDRLKEENDINAVVIATPNYLHAPMAIAAMESGKDVLCEIPLATSSREVEDMVSTAQRERRRLMPCLATRLRVDVQIVRKYIEHQDLGQLYYAKTGWLRGRQAWSPSSWQRERQLAGGGAFLNLGSVLLDSALWLLAPARPISIIGVGAGHRGKNGKTDRTVEDTAFALIRFDTGFVLTVEVGWSLLLERDFVYFNLFGTQGAAVLNPLTINKEVQGRLVNITPGITIRAQVRSAYQQLIKKWIDALLKDTAPEVAVADALLINQLADAFYISNASGAEVRLSVLKG